MMLIPFLPSNTSSPPFSTLVTLDGQSYTLATMWNFYRGGWYVSLRGQGGALIINQPLIGSPPAPANPILLFPGLFTTSTVYYLPSTGTIVIEP